MNKSTLNEDLQIFNRLARAFNTSVEINRDPKDDGIALDVLAGIRAAACEVYQQMSAFYNAPKRSVFLKACGVWEPKDGNR